MDLQRSRMILMMLLFIVLMALFNLWQKEHASVVEPVNQESAENAINNAFDIPQYHDKTPKKHVAQHQIQNIESKELITVDTDVLKLMINPIGGDIVKAELKQYNANNNAANTTDEKFILLDYTDENLFIAQTGLISDYGPESLNSGRARYSVEKNFYKLADNADSLDFEMYWYVKNIKITKFYHLERSNYLVKVGYKIENLSNETWSGEFYGQARKLWKNSKSKGFFTAQMYQGAAWKTTDKPFKKVSFGEIKDAAKSQSIIGGWAAILERYFLCAWIPDQQTSQNYYTRYDNGDIYNIGSISSLTVPAHKSAEISGSWYLGPEVIDNLKGLSTGLELTIDYGILWPVSQLLFWMLKYINMFLSNWGWSIIVLTLFVKLAFYKLSASSYKSMGNMRRVQPKIEALKVQCGEDKQKFSQGMLELYKKEKVNPLGGCLPIIVQIPVFIALYYVLLESVELRQAPFVLWIHDLSQKDPYYVLPIIMGISMLVQQKLNPAPADPMQAKIMMLMPLIFTVLFLSFPAGLVLYWVVNNLLSILQQWYITKNISKHDGSKSLRR